jgi:hypothetical protein
VPNQDRIPTGCGRLAPHFGRYRLLLREHPLLGQQGLPYLALVLGGGMLNLGLPLLFGALCASHPSGDIGTWGIVMSAHYCGMMLAAGVLPGLMDGARDRCPPRWVFMGLALVLPVFALARTPLHLLVLVFPTSFGFTCLHIRIESRIQRAAPRPSVGTVMGMATIFRGGGYLVAIVGGAGAAAVLGTGAVFLLGALCLAAGAWARQGLTCRQMRAGFQSHRSDET